MNCDVCGVREAAWERHGGGKVRCSECLSANRRHAGWGLIASVRPRPREWEEGDAQRLSDALDSALQTVTNWQHAANEVDRLCDPMGGTSDPAKLLVVVRALKEANGHLREEVRALKAHKHEVDSLLCSNTCDLILAEEALKEAHRAAWDGVPDSDRLDNVQSILRAFIDAKAKRIGERKARS